MKLQQKLNALTIKYHSHSKDVKKMFIFMAKNKRNGIKDFTKLVIPRYVIFGDFEIRD